MKATTYGYPEGGPANRRPAAGPGVPPGIPDVRAPAPLRTASVVPARSREGMQAMTSDQTEFEAALGDAERRLQSAVRAGDVEALDRLLDDRAVYTGPDGGTLTKQEDLEAHRSGSLVVEAFDQEDLRVAVAGTTGVTRVLATLRGRAAGRPFAARLRYTRAWVHADGTWRVLAAHASVVTT